jgi:hypothetical protein
MAGWWACAEDMNAEDWRREDSAATGNRAGGALERMQAEGIESSPGVLTLVEQYADGALRIPELVYRGPMRARRSRRRSACRALPEAGAFGCAVRRRRFETIAFYALPCAGLPSAANQPAYGVSATWQRL